MVLVFVVSGEPMLVQAGSLYLLFIYSTSYDLIYKAKRHMFLGPTITLMFYR